MKRRNETLVDGEVGTVVILGGGIMGLLAAAATAGRARRVLILERDRIENGAVRRGVPQGAQVHGLLAGAVRAVERLLPGFTRETAEAGAAHADMMRDAVLCLGGFELAGASSDLSVLAATRPFLEHQLRNRVLRQLNVELLQGIRVRALVAEEGAIVGVRVSRDNREREVRGDLVIDCTGRASNTPAELRRLGMPAPVREARPLDVFYASRLYRIDPNRLGGRKAFIVGPTPAHPRAGLAQLVEHGQLLIGLTGYGPHRPPADDRALLDHARQLASPIIADLLEHAEPIGPVSRFGLRECARWRYDLVKRPPAGLLVMGDALCSLNPVYAQGMTMAALQAEALRDQLERGVDRKQLASRFYASVAPVIHNTWRMGAGADSSLPTFTGRRPWIAKLIGGWIRRVQWSGASDPVVAAAFGRVMALVDEPKALFRPGLVWRVLFNSRGAKAAADSPRPLPARVP